MSPLKESFCWQTILKATAFDIIVTCRGFQRWRGDGGSSGGQTPPIELDGVGNLMLGIEVDQWLYKSGCEAIRSWKTNSMVCGVPHPCKKSYKFWRQIGTLGRTFRLCFRSIIWSKCNPVWSNSSPTESLKKKISSIERSSLTKSLNPLPLDARRCQLFMGENNILICFRCL